LNESQAPFSWDSYDPSTALSSYAAPYSTDEVVSISQEMVLFVGYPGAGKSTFAKTHFVPRGYVHVNQDTLKTKEKCKAAAGDALASGKSVVIDNTNPSTSIRQEFIEIAQANGVPVRCFVFQTDQELARHCNMSREKISGTAHVPIIAYRTYSSHFSEPSLAEGFSQIKKIDWIPAFPSEAQKKVFMERT